MSKPKLFYFNVRGRGELIRLVFAASGTEFEDNRLTQEQWAEKKKDSPSGFMPFVDTGDAKQGVLSQSGAIARYFAKKAGLMGSNEWEYYLVERAMGQLDDIFMELVKIFMGPEDKKAEVTQSFKTEKGPKLLNGLVAYLKQTDGPFFLGNSLSLADLNCLAVMDAMGGFSDMLNGYPELHNLKKEALAKNAKLAEYLKNRPVTPM